MPDLDSDYDDSAQSWWSDSSNAPSAGDYPADPDPSGVPGYDMNSALPNTQTDPPDSKTPFPTNATAAAGRVPDYPGDQISTEMNTSATSTGMNAMAAGAIPSLNQSVAAMPDRTLQIPDADQGHGNGQGQPPQPAVNVWQPVEMSGYLAADLTYTDQGLIAALQAAATAAGGQAAALAPTIDLEGDTVVAGGGASVGSRGAPASALAIGSEYNTAPQFSCGPWFFPAVAAWAAANPPPQYAGQEGQDTQSEGGEFQT